MLKLLSSVILQLYRVNDFAVELISCFNVYLPFILRQFVAMDNPI